MNSVDQMQVLPLPELQNAMKRDPTMYSAEFEQHIHSFDAQASIYEIAPTKDTKDFGKLATFLAHVSFLFPKLKRNFATDLFKLFETSYLKMMPSLRCTLFKALILLKNKKQLDQVKLLELCLTLFNVQDKHLRSIVFGFVIQDIKNSNKMANNHKLNASVRLLVMQILDEESNCTLKGLQVLIDLYKMRVLTDEKTVNVIAKGLSLKSPKLLRLCVGFFLGIDEAIDSLEQDEAEEREQNLTMNAGGKSGENVMQLLQKRKNSRKHSKKTSARERLDKKETRMLQKFRKEVHSQHLERLGNVAELKRKAEPRFAAIELVNDPLDLVETLFKRLNKHNDLFQVRLNIINLQSRLIGIHKVIFLPFFSYLRKFLTPHQKLVTNFLASYVQACHDLIPGEILLPNVRHLADEFVNDRSGAEVMAIGLNTIREIVTRVPSVTKEEGVGDLINDLVQYKTYKRSKSVVMAARSLLNVVRDINPEILERKERGKLGQIMKDERASKLLGYGESNVRSRIDGIELLQEGEEGQVEAEQMLTDSDFARIKRKLANRDAEVIENLKRKKMEEKSYKTSVQNSLVKQFGKEEEQKSIVSGIEDEDDESDVFTDSESDSDDDVNALGIVDSRQLEGHVRRKKRDLEERLASAQEGRENGKFKNINTRTAGTNNSEKLKSKSFQMVKYSTRVKKKQSMSLRQQQHTIKKHIKNLERNKKTMQKISRRRRK